MIDAALPWSERVTARLSDPALKAYRAAWPYDDGEILDFLFPSDLRLDAVGQPFFPAGRMKNATSSPRVRDPALARQVAGLLGAAIIGGTLAAVRCWAWLTRTPFHKE